MAFLKLQKQRYDKAVKESEYRIIQYPYKGSPSGRIFFVDKKVKRKILFLFSYTAWETVKYKTGESMTWFNFNECTHDVATLKEGKKLYK